MKRVKFTLGLMLSFLLMGASVAHADIYIPAGSNMQTVLSTKTPAQIGVIFAGCTYQGAVSGDQDTIVGTPTVLLFNGGAAMSGLTTSDIEQLISLTDAAGSDFTVNLAGFSALTSLNVSGATHLTLINQIGSTSLETLNASNCSHLASLGNVSTCTTLKTLNVSGSGLNSLTVPATVTSLDVTDCIDLTSLDVSACTTLLKDKSLTISGCPSLTNLTTTSDLEKLTIINGCVPSSIPATLKTLSINVSNDATSTSLNIPGLGLETLNVSGALTDLDCSGINLTSLDVTKCPALTTLNCSNNKLTSLDVTNCPALAALNCSNNMILSIDISNTAIGNLTSSSFGNFKQNGDISIVNNKQTTEMTNVPDYIKEITKGKYYNITYKTNIDVDAYLIKKAIKGYKVKVANDDVPGYELQSLKVTKSNGSAVIVEPGNIFEMPASDVTVECVFVPKANPKTYTIDWAIIDVDNDNQIVSSKGNEVDGFAIIVPGSAVEGSEITFSIRSNYTYKIDAISVEVLYSGYGDSDEFHAVSFTDLNDGGVSDGSDKTGGSYKFRMPIGNVKITLRVNDSSKPGLPTLPNPIIRHGVQIISNGLQTSPGAANGSNGYHYVAGNQNFTFTVYSVKPINVKTNRGNDEEGVIIEDNGNGSWKVTIKRVSTNLVVTVTEVTTESGTGENGTTGNEAIAKDAVWAANGTLYVKTTTPGFMTIYNVTGQLCKQVAVSGDATFTLSRGIYIVQLNGKAYKVVL